MIYYSTYDLLMIYLWFTYEFKLVMIYLWSLMITYYTYDFTNVVGWYHCAQPYSRAIHSELLAGGPLEHLESWPVVQEQFFFMNLVCTGTYWYIPVRTHMYEFSKYILVCTEYIPKQSHAFWTQIEALIQCWNTTVCMSHIHSTSIVSNSHLTQKSILRNISVLMVHTSMH